MNTTTTNPQNSQTGNSQTSDSQTSDSQTSNSQTSDSQAGYDGPQAHDSHSTGYSGAGGPFGSGGSGARPLERPAHDRMLVGVASGAARYLGVDPTVIRIIFAVLVVVGGVGVPLYLAGWLLIPEEGHDQSLASELIDSFQSRSR
jgi:phage shock protein PspC (stress-responsive transcriptional regulator)